ncbi:MAG: hypothetical protein KW802_02380 [Candidatus Doudnabacteria bacterium]|nr:hypothetical protein [Candidatus Doudnabacteria bacterium]
MRNLLLVMVGFCVIVFGYLFLLGVTLTYVTFVLAAAALALAIIFHEVHYQVWLYAPDPVADAFRIIFWCTVAALVYPLATRWSYQPAWTWHRFWISVGILLTGIVLATCRMKIGVERRAT